MSPPCPGGKSPPTWESCDRRVHWLFVGCLTPGPSSGKEYVKHVMPQHYTSTKQATQRQRSMKFTVALILFVRGHAVGDIPAGPHRSNSWFYNILPWQRAQAAGGCTALPSQPVPPESSKEMVTVSPKALKPKVKVATRTFLQTVFIEWWEDAPGEFTAKPFLELKHPAASLTKKWVS